MNSPDVSSSEGGIITKDSILLFLISVANWTIAPILALVTPRIKVDLVDITSTAALTFVDSAFLLVSGIMAFIWALLAEKYKRNRLLTINLILGCTGMLLTAFANNFWQILVFQMITGIGYGAVLPLSMSILVDITQHTQRGRAFGLFSISTLAGMGLSSLLTVFLIDIVQWRGAFIISAILLAAGITCTILLKEPQVGRKEKAFEDLSDEHVAQARVRLNWNEIKKVLRSKTTLWLICILFLSSMTTNSINFANPTFFIDTIGLSEMGYFFLFLHSIIGAFGGPYWGGKADKRFQVKRNVKVNYSIKLRVFANTLYTLGYIIVFYITLNVSFWAGLVIFFALMAVGNFFAGGFDPLMNSTLGDIHAPELRSTIYSLRQLIGVIGASLGSVFMGFISLSFGGFFWGILFMYIVNFIAVMMFIVPIKSVKGEIEDLEKELLKRREKLNID